MVCNDIFLDGEHDCKEVDEFVVITGKGLHSRGEPVIKPAIEGIFAARKFVFKEVEGNSGRLVVGFEVIKAKI